ncbi:cyclic nucleotide-binding domain-containing protein [Maritimibacter sp. DP07]|uniref:Cyclic nucleotide-binding domain-containing protein n=1 Tax=Maritimibacter harenae TaxID=2606218 RepID=A0A845LZJ8_9RHOB|nr:Crp/Fnr family transcriptional regulator [Maritimibacter harenae]MZR12209.1 cyclic nucleotide-binding domain-containing protein [Maritimibacter harenae]
MLIDSEITSEASPHVLILAERGVELFREADPRAVRALAERAYVARFKSGATIFAQGEPAENIALLLCGTVKVVDLTEDGVSHIMSLLAPGDIVGDIGAPQSRLSWEAATDVIVCVLKRITFEELLSQHPTLQKGYLAATIHQLEKERLWASSMRGKGTLQRVAAWLFTQSPQDSGMTETALPLSLSRRDIASLLDMSPETLCRALHTIMDMEAIWMPTPDLVVVQQRERLRMIAKGVRSPIPSSMRSSPGASGSFSVAARGRWNNGNAKSFALDDGGLPTPTGRA